MAIENITPSPKSTIGAGDALSFDVTSTYTQMDITADGASVYTTAGGEQSGYTVSVVESGSTHTFTIKKTAGWDADITLIQVTEDQDTDVAVTRFSYNLADLFPRHNNPKATDFAKLKISEDDGTPIEGVTQIDLVTGTPPDGMDATGTTPTAIIAATAATTDPDAIHGNVSSEFTGLTTKGIDVSTLNDWLVIEDSDASYAKKRCTVRSLVGYGSPSKLGTEYSPLFLYLFNNNYNNDGSVTDSRVDPLATGLGQSNRMMFDDRAGDEEGRHFQNNSSSKASSVTITSAPASWSAVGECTVQWYGQIGGYGTNYRGATEGYCMFAFRSQNRAYEKICWGLFLDNDGSNQNFYYPKFAYSNAADSAVYEIMDTSYVLQEMNRYHIVGRRQDDGLGGGTYNASLWVNGLKVAETTGLPEAYAAVSSNRMTHGSETGGEGLSRVSIYCSKMNNSALTDAQIHSEYKKALGYV